MRLKTYQGGMGSTVRGLFETEVSGLGDTKLAALISLKNTTSHKVHVNLGLSLPTGDIEQRGAVLTPMSEMPMQMRLPYAMQLGSGTYDFEPGITYTHFRDASSYGTQYKAVIRSGENSQGYQLGNKQQLSLWGQYLFTPAVSVSARITLSASDAIKGQDANIMGPVQTADPDNYGTQAAFFSAGINLLGQSNWLSKHRLALEYTLPLHQDVNGVQMKMQNMFNVGYQYPF